MKVPTNKNLSTLRVVDDAFLREIRYMVLQKAAVHFSLTHTQVEVVILALEKKGVLELEDPTDKGN